MAGIVAKKVFNPFEFFNIDSWDDWAQCNNKQVSQQSLIMSCNYVFFYDVNNISYQMLNDMTLT